jgi:oxygen-independent coproporphyrinogen-3 oxidase
MIYSPNVALRYKESLVNEIKMVGEGSNGKEVSSLYFGGGTPALMTRE